MPSFAQHIGYEAEKLALNYLIKQGLTLVQQNFTCKQGEIDLIMQDQEEYVFVEVRLRPNASHGGAVESITLSKQRKIINAATMYLVQKKLYDKVPCRFDVIAVTALTSPIYWIKNAFQVK